jgi:hypothetical protein
MARLSLVASLLVISCVQALAESKHDVSSMTCPRVQAILDAEGSATLRYRSQRNPSLVLYDRYVASRRYCGLKMDTLASTVYVASGQPCRVSKCVRIQSDD